MEKIAQGGMAEIFKGLAYDTAGIKRTVCIKKILPHIAASPEFIESLIAEAKIAVTLSHGNIAQTYDLGKVGDDYFIVMEYVDGKSLSQIAKRAAAKKERVPLPMVCSVMAEVASGLDYIHRRTDAKGEPLHIVHRDMSPQNIICSYSGTIKIIDFGIAIAAGRIAITDTGILKGKFSFMSPEQARGDPLDHRSDIFSLGIVMYELLTGERLFKADDNRETLRNVRRARVTSPAVLRPDLPEELDRICMKALAREKRHRFTSAAEMRDALMKFLHTTFPNFQPTDVASYLRGLFPDDVAHETKEEEIKTPHLIIDATHSALTGDDDKSEKTGVSKAPVDLEPFLLEPVEHEENEAKKNQKLVLDDDEEQTSQKKRESWLPLMVVGIIVVVSIVAWVSLRKNNETTDVLAPRFSKLSISVTPEDAEVTLNGESLGQHSPYTREKLIPKREYTIHAKKEGYIPQEKIFTPVPGENLSFSLSLLPEVAVETALSMTTEPPGASVFLDEQKTALTTPATLKAISPGRHTIGLFLPNHKFWEKEIMVQKGETLHFDIGLAKDLGTLTITSQPAGALVLLDGKPIGQTPLTQEGLEPEKIYAVEIWTEGFEPYTQDVKIRAGREEEVRVTLKKEGHE